MKYRDLKKLEARRSYRGFLERYHLESGYIVNKSLSAETMVGETWVHCLPYWELMFEEAFSVEPIDGNYETFEFLRVWSLLSFPCRRESSYFNTFWIPASAGMTK